MSIVGILTSNLFASGAAQGAQNTQNTNGGTSNFQQLKTEFQQLGQDLQAGNLTQAQQDYATISQQLPGTNQAAAVTAGANATNTTSTNPILQAFAQLGQDLQAGNLQAAQQDFTTVQQDAQQNAQNAQQTQGHHRHHHHGGGQTQNAQNSNSSSQTNPISQAFSTLAQDLQAGNLSGAQSAFATLQNDLQQIGGFLPSTPSSTAASSGTTANLNVSA